MTDFAAERETVIEQQPGRSRYPYSHRRAHLIPVLHWPPFIVRLNYGGNIHFSHSGKYVYPADQLAPNGGPLGLAVKRGQLVRVRPNDVHGGVFGEGGGVFLSVQHWLNGVKPHCVAADYDGLTMGEHHLAGVKYGKAQVKKTLTPKDAASLEH